MKILVTGSAGLVGSETCAHFAKAGFDIIGIDNDMRSVFFGKDASIKWNLQHLQESLGRAYIHIENDIRDQKALQDVFTTHARSFKAIVHTAAQPSHDWAAKDPHADFAINATGTLNLLELARNYCPETPFIFMSTNKVYGDRPNSLPLIEQDLRWEIASDHPYTNGIDEEMSLDQTKHSIFGASKVAADVLTQEYGRYFNMPTVCFRGGCLTGPRHSGTMLHGFLSYLMKCTVIGEPYTVFGYYGKQVRDNIHSHDLVRMFEEFCKNPKCGAVYNAGGSRVSNCSLREAIRICEGISGKKLTATYSESNRIGDHIWWISSVEKFKRDYPKWELTYSVPSILEEIYKLNVDRWLHEKAN